jgi:1-acyl-sn-glycerol-3-phosphate acyltransferase
MEVKGKENLPKEGRIIAVCNHLNLIDPVLHIMAIMPRDSIFMAKEELFKWWPIPLFRILMDISEAFPIARRGTPEQQRVAIERGIEVLKHEMVFCMYPEGTRSKSARLKNAYHGVTLIACRTKAPLIPVAIWGTENLKGKGWLSRPRVTISFGMPFTLPPVEGEPDREILKGLTHFVMQKLAAELPPKYRGRYDPDQQTAEAKAAVYA